MPKNRRAGSSVVARKAQNVRAHNQHQTMASPSGIDRQSISGDSDSSASGIQKRLNAGEQRWRGSAAKLYPQDGLSPGLVGSMRQNFEKPGSGGASGANSASATPSPYARRGKNYLASLLEADVPMQQQVLKAVATAEINGNSVGDGHQESKQFNSIQFIYSICVILNCKPRKLISFFGIKVLITVSHLRSFLIEHFSTRS